MKNYEQFKRLIMFVIGIVIISLLVLTFAFVWYTQYNDSIIMPFVNRGNWLVIAIYLVLLVLFQRIYNGYKVGYLKRSDVIYSQTLSVLITNVITYFQVSLIGRGLVNPVPFFLM
ncbi:MAG: sugar transferase, partial [Clostridia bacterium]